jgi:hypothetical protein
VAWKKKNEAKVQGRTVNRFLRQGRDSGGRRERRRRKKHQEKKQMRNKRKLNSTCGPKNSFLLPQLRNKPGAQRLTPSAQLRDDIRKPARFANVFAQYLAKWATLKATQPHPE